jgi:DNA repair exonuclease SbcCD ATPase subunit
VILIHDLFVSYFKSFRGKQVFRFSNAAGLYLVSAENRAYPELQGNACGKSSLFDALSWVWFGKTARGLKSTDIANWETRKQTRVSVGFSCSQIKYKLTRCHKPNALTLSTNGEAPVVVTQAQIENILGFNHDVFLAAVLMGQFGRFFFDLGATEKLQVFSDILSLQFWQDKAKHAGNLADSAQTNFNKAELRSVELSATLKITNEQLADARKQIERFDNDRADKVAQLESEVRRAETVLLEREKISTRAKQELDGLEPLADLKLEQDKVNELRKGLTVVERNKERGIDNQKRYTTELDRLYRADKKCPVCGSEMDRAHFKGEENRLLGLMEMATKVVQTERAAAERQKVVLERAECRWSDAVAENAARRDLQEKVALGVSTAQNRVENARNAYLDARKRWKTARGEPNPHVERAKTLFNRAQQLAMEQKENKEQLAGYSADLSGFAYWTKELKNLRLWLVKSSLLQLEVEIGNCLLQLGLRGWRIVFEIERVTAAGTVSRGFNVFIQAPNAPSRVKWESFSGGETTRLRIASAAGLSALVRNRYGVALPVEIWDEPLSFVSPGCVENLLEFFKQRAEDERRAVYLIEHHVKSSGLFDGHIRVIRTTDGSRIMNG